MPQDERSRSYSQRLTSSAKVRFRGSSGSSDSFKEMASQRVKAKNNDFDRLKVQIRTPALQPTKLISMSKITQAFGKLQGNVKYAQNHV